MSLGQEQSAPNGASQVAEPRLLVEGAGAFSSEDFTPQKEQDWAQQPPALHPGSLLWDVYSDPVLQS